MPRSDPVLPQALEQARLAQFEQARRRPASRGLTQADPVRAAAYRQALNFVNWGAAVQGGRNAEGLSAAVEALERLEAVGWGEQLHWCFGALGFSLALAGDLEAALRYIERGLADARRQGDDKAYRARLGNKGAALAVAGQRQLAIQVYEQALAQSPEGPEGLNERFQLHNNIAYCQLLLARRAEPAVRSELAGAALMHTEAALPLLQALEALKAQPPWRRAWVLSHHGAALTLLGRLAEAEAVLREAQPLALGHQRVALTLAVHLAQLLCADGRHNEARVQLQGALQLDVEALLDPSVDELQECFMRLEIQCGQSDAALHWAALRMARLEARHQRQLETVRRHLELFQRIDQERQLERERNQQQLRFWQDEALRDPLCGTLNRRGLQAAAQALLQPDSAVAVLMLDLDHFKRINDSFGHALGDEVLRRATERMQGVIREGDVLARLGGEEFCVLLPHCQPEQALRIADKLRLQIERTAWAELAPALQVTVSAGVSAGSGADPLDALIEAADQGLYAAKAAGRNRVASVGAGAP
ncbi:MAG: diguanylate cyclase [Inhella sp.]